MPGTLHLRSFKEQKITVILQGSEEEFSRLIEFARLVKEEKLKLVEGDY